MKCWYVNLLTIFFNFRENDVMKEFKAQISNLVLGKSSYGPQIVGFNDSKLQEDPTPSKLVNK